MYVVALYKPAGNIPKQLRQNVLEPGPRGNDPDVYSTLFRRQFEDAKSLGRIQRKTPIEGWTKESRQEVQRSYRVCVFVNLVPRSSTVTDSVHTSEIWARVYDLVYIFTREQQGFLCLQSRDFFSVFQSDKVHYLARKIIANTRLPFCSSYFLLLLNSKPRYSACAFSLSFDKQKDSFGLIKTEGTL